MGYKIFGRVRREDNSAPYAAVRVTDNAPASAGGPRFEITDANGEFVMRTDIGQYSISFLTPGAYTHTESNQWLEYSDLFVDLSLPPADPLGGGTPPSTPGTASASVPGPNATATWLSVVVGTDDNGEDRLKYTWELAPVPDNKPAGGAIWFPADDNGRHSASRALMAVTKAGTYVVRAKVTY